MADGAAQAGVQILKETLEAAIKKLRRSWQAYQTNDKNARAVLDYAERVMDILQPYSPSELEQRLGPVKNALDEKVKEIERAAEQVQEEVKTAQTLGGKLQRFVYAESTREMLQALQVELKRILDDLEEKLRVENLVRGHIEGFVLETIQNESAKSFWRVHAGAKTWSMPFHVFVEFYELEARAAAGLKFAPPTSQATPVQTSPGATTNGPAGTGQPRRPFKCFGCLRRGQAQPPQQTNGVGKQLHATDPTANPAMTAIPLPAADPAAVAAAQRQQPSGSSPAAFPYRELTREDRKALLYALCGEEGETPTKLLEKNEEVTVFALNRFIKSYGFPFNPAGLPEPPAVFAPVFSMTDRLSIASMCIGLQTEFARPETDALINHVIEVVNAQAKEIKDAANPALTDDKQTAKYEERQLRCFAADKLVRNLRKEDFAKLNASRRSWSFFLQRFMTMWRLCELTQELFTDIDFPGTGRIVTFMEYCEPLDEANFRIKIKDWKGTVDELDQTKRDDLSNQWEEARPKVYDFLRTLLRWKDERDNKGRALKAPRPVQFGGIVPPPNVP